MYDCINARPKNELAGPVFRLLYVNVGVIPPFMVTVNEWKWTYRIAQRSVWLFPL
jgi:hypothetical protein